ncbi:protoporphyrinogen/coproporphyrinogen oxidase [Salinactinospora qingdaonensis]|uniref:Protoporphyrinogen oxidase n=1 Tax=Salinactinospora qingdaonensis TaxID=702744 RepID=A0ABP7GB84_9ACTN
MSTERAEFDVVIVGAGPAGLALAHTLSRTGRRVRVLESADAVGGRMRTLRSDGYLIDTGAEMIASAGYPATWSLIRDLGLSTAEVPRVPHPMALWRAGRSHPRVGHPAGLLTGAGLSVAARLDLARLLAWGTRERARFDPERPAHTPVGHLSVAEALRSYHPEVGEYLVKPLAAGFFGWDSATTAAAPVLAHLFATGGAAGLRTYRDGMDTLARRLADQLDVVTGCHVREVAHRHDAHGRPVGVRVNYDGGSLDAERAVLAVPAPVATRLYPTAPADERAFLKTCDYAPMLRISLALDRPLAVRPGRGDFATLIPHTHDTELAVVTADHRKHPGRVPEGRGLVSLIPTPATTKHLLAQPDSVAVERLTARAERYVPGLRAALVAATVHRFPHGLPEVTPRALALHTQFTTRPVRAVDYAGDWLALRPCSEGAFSTAQTTAARVCEPVTDAVAVPGGGRPS